MVLKNALSASIRKQVFFCFFFHEIECDGMTTFMKFYTPNIQQVRNVINLILTEMSELYLAFGRINKKETKINISPPENFF